MSEDIVELLRVKNEEPDLDNVLAVSMGKYTKKSVQDYVSRLTNQQQSTVEQFNKELQTLLEDKEKLQKQIADLSGKLEKSQAAYRALSEQVSTHKLEGSDFTLEDMLELKNQLAALEQDMDEAVAQIRQDEQQHSRDQFALEEKDKQLEQTGQELALLREQLKTARAEGDDQRRTITNLTTTVSEQQSEIRFLKEITSEGSVGELNERLDRFAVTVKQQEDEIGVRGEQIAALKEQNAVMLAEKEQDAALLSKLRAALEEESARNEKLTAASDLLTGRISQMMEHTVSLMKEQSDLRVDNAILKRKLDTASLKLAAAGVLPKQEET